MTQDAECRSCFVLKPNRATQFFAFHFSLRIHPFANLEFLERLDSLSGSWQHTEDVESDSLAERSALTNSDLVTFFDTESRRDVSSEVLMSLLVSGVFGDEVKVFSADDQGSVHLGRDDGAGEDTASDGDHTGERAFLVDVSTLNGGLWCSEAQADIFVPSSSTLANSSALCGLGFVVEEDVRLLLVGALGLNCQLGRHDCGC